MTRGAYMLSNLNNYILSKVMYAPVLRHSSNNVTQVLPPLVALKITLGTQM